MTQLQPVRWVVFTVLLVFLLLIVTSLLSLRTRIVGLEEGSTTGSVWFMRSLESDALKLELALANNANGQVDTDAIKQRFDILWSRLVSAQQGTIAKKLTEYEADTTVLDRLFALLRDNDDFIANLTDQPRSSVSVSDFKNKIAAFEGDLHKLSLEVLEGTSQEARSWRDDLVWLSSQNSLLIGLVAVALIIIAVLLILENLQTKSAMLEKEGLLKKARAANIEKSQFISVMNHELRTPLASIRGAISLLHSQFAPNYGDKEQRLIEIANRNTKHLSALVQDILEVESFGSGRFEMNLELVSLSYLVSQQMPEFHQLGKDYGIIVETYDTMSDVTCRVDSNRMRQVLSNVVFNAIKFSVAGTTVRIDVRRDGDKGIISVSDEGVGIPDVAQSRIFDAFYQVDSSNVRRVGGTGLGLSISKSLVEAMEGNISLDSQIGRGTTFFLQFPAHDDVSAHASNSSSTAA